MKVGLLLSLKNRKMIYLFTLLLTFVCQSSFAIPWPQELTGKKGKIVVYQPQPEKLEGNVITGRAAMSLEWNNSDTPVFGVFWFTSTIETDRDADTVIMENIQVIKVGWPESKDSAEEKFTQFVEQQLQNASFTTSFSKLAASLATAAEIKKSLDNIKNDAPTILFKDKLAVLLSYDGNPIFKSIKNSPYQRAVNTPLAVVKANNSQYYLTSGSLWYQASSALGPWNPTFNPPTDLVAMIPKEEDQEKQEKVTKVPAIVTVTTTSELVVTDGKANWTSLEGGQLLYVENTETPWLRELTSGDMYILLSGRWFKSKSEQGPWVFVRADKLPKSFQDIPPKSAIGGLRTSVAGTDEAEQAVLDAQIPQTAAIKRSEAKLTVQYDGQPKFELISGTEVEYAVNTSAQVLKIKGNYYAVDNGVWFVANYAKGPWIVADNIPKEAIAQIPPSSPMYNTTYVTIYDSTPKVVYVGYTPGYMWSYPYYGVPIYGTGWYYPPYYVGGWYYPRPPTWGLHVGYNPWTGWNVGVSWGGPFFHTGFRWGGGYHHYRPCCGGGFHGGGFYGGHNNINVHGRVNIGNSVSIANRATITNRAKMSNTKNWKNRKGNIYSRGDNKLRNANRTPRNNKLQRGAYNKERANNVFAGKRGNVYKHENGQWQNRSNRDNSWKNIPRQRNISNQPMNKLPSQTKRSLNKRPSFDRSGMNRQLRSRQMGRMRGGQRFGGRRR